MQDMIGDLDSMVTDLHNWQDQLREVTWPSRSLSLQANDVIIMLGMSARSVGNLSEVLAGLEEAKAEVKELEKEEEGGEDLGEQVPGEEVHEERPPAAPQEPDTGRSEGS